MNRSRVVLALFGLFLLTTAMEAHAISKGEAEAEHVRLSEEMNRLARRSGLCLGNWRCARW